MIRRFREPDAILRRFERNQAVAALLMALAPLVAGRWDVALGVVCGAGLMMFSYRAIKGAVELIVPAGGALAAPTPAACPEPPSSGDRHPEHASREETEPRAGAGKSSLSAKRRWLLAMMFAGRYALLALAAYVMLARLHAHPIGLLLGAASPVVAVAVEAMHFIRTPSRPERSR